MRINFFRQPLLLLLSVLVFLMSGSLVMAQESKQVTIVNPIRGQDFWSYNYSILETPKNEYQAIAKNNLAATWLVRYDALTSPEVVTFLKGLNSNQEVGLFLEVTPTFARDAGVVYNESPNWHYAKSVLLIGYSPADRQKLIDTAVKKYQDALGHGVKSVGAWWIDAGSLVYLHDKYQITTSMDVADQYSTDQYQVWGQYFSLPFYPSKTNALLPAQSESQKIGTVMIQWATRDPFNSFGNGVGDSTYSVQSNDYLLHDLGVDYFEKLLNIYPQVTVGLENDFDWTKYGPEYQKQLDLVKKSRASVMTMERYGQYYQAVNPGISPNVLLQANDPLGSGGKVIWYQTPKYRVGWFINSKGSVIRDLRIYDESSRELCLTTACSSLNLATTFINSVDEVTYGSSWVIDEGRINDVRVFEQPSQVRIDYTNQAGVGRYIKFLPNDVDINGKVYTLASAVMQAHILPKVVNKISLIGDGVIDYRSIFGVVVWNGMKFLFLTIVFWLIPGWVLTRRLVVAIPVGWAFFTLACFGLGYLNMSWGIWLLPATCLGWMVKNPRPKLVLPIRDRFNLTVLAVIILGSLSWLLTVAKSGLQYPFGLGYWGPNGHDAIWHLSLINELIREFPPQIPVFSGVALTNYHYFFDLLVARSAGVLGIDVQELLFRLFPLLISILIGWLTYLVTRKIYHKQAGLLAVFLVYFGGSFGWVLTWFKDHSFGGESLFWAQQSVSTLLNPPYAISLVLLLAGIYLFSELMEQRYRSKLTILALIGLWGTLIEFKVYAGVLLLAGLAVVGIYQLVFRRSLFSLMIFGLCLGLSLLVFLPNNLGASSLIVLSPFWLVNSMVDFPDRLGWQRLAMARQVYSDTGNGFKFYMAEALGLLIFLLGNMGTRVLMFGGVPQQIKRSLSGEVLLQLLGVIFWVGLGLSLIFIQKGTNWNIIQFFYYSLFVANIMAAGFVVGLARRLPKSFKMGLIGLIVVLTVPTTIITLEQQYWSYRPPTALPVMELAGLNFLKTQPPGSVMTLQFDERSKLDYAEPLPLFAYTSTAYVSAFSNHQTFLEDTINLDILGVDYKGRLNDQRDFAKFKERSKEILERNHIKYVYVVKAANFQEDEARMGIHKIFENDMVKIFKVQ